MFNHCLFLAYGADAALVIAYTVSTIASIAGSVVSYQQQREAAKQTEMNAEAQAKALAMERQRKAAELAENQRRLAQQQRRERAAQFSALANTGFVATTGTPIEVMADTVEAHQRNMSDLTGDANLDQWRLGYQGQSLLDEARSKASLMRQQAGASLITGLAGTVSDAYGKFSKPSSGQAPAGGSPSSKPASSGQTLLRSTDYKGSRTFS